MSAMIANTEMAAVWDGPEGSHWAVHQERFDRTIAPYHRHLMAGTAIGAGETVLDVGCGNGLSTRDAARAAAEGSALGVDLSAAMLGVARGLAEDEGLKNVRFEQADAQVHPFEPAAFDLIMSRFGVMFFAEPVAAFANLAGALRPGGRLCLLVWQPPDRNPWALAVAGALAAGRDLPPPPPGAPGPFALGDPDHTRGILTEAGFSGVDFAGIEEPFHVGRDGDDAYEFISGLQLVTTMLEGLDDTARQGALDALRAAFVAHESPEGVVFDSAAWVVTATTT